MTNFKGGNQKGCPIKVVYASLTDIYFFMTQYRQNSQGFFQVGCPVRAVSDSFVDNNSSSILIGYQPQHGPFSTELISFNTNFTKKIQEGCPMRTVAASLSDIYLSIIPFQKKKIGSFSIEISSEVHRCLICQLYFFKLPPW